MATLNIVEFKGMALDIYGNVMPAPLMPFIAKKTVTYTTSTQSAALSDDCRLVYLKPDADCYVEFGSNPTATAASFAIEANQGIYLGISPHGGAMKIAAYDGSS